MRIHKWLASYWIALTVALSSNLYADDHQLLEIASSESMLVQQMLQSYCQIGMHEIYGEPQDALIKAIDQFDWQLKVMEKNVKEASEKEPFDELKAIWPSYKKLILERPVTKANAFKLLTINTNMLDINHELIEALEESTGSDLAETVDMAGYQRVLAERMAMFYLFKIWVVTDPTIDEGLKKTINDFTSVHKKLEARPYNNEIINTNLLRVKRSMELLEHAMTDKQKNLSFMVATTSEQIRKAMNEVTAEYAIMSRAASPNPGH